MAFSNIDGLSLGSLLQILFTEGVRSQISQDFRDYDMIYRGRIKDSMAREKRFQLLTGFGPAAIQYVNPGSSNRVFPRGQQSLIGEKTAKLKEVNGTIDIEYQLWNRARLSPEKYAEPLALEVMSKNTASKRRIAADTYGDGLGVIGQLGASAAAVTSPASDQLVFTISSANTARGHIGFFEFQDILILRASSGAASALDTNLDTKPVYWLVVDKDREAGTVKLQGLNSSFASAGTISSITTQPASGDVFYRYAQPTIPDLTAAVSDYGTATEVFPGLESLSADDSRVVHGITMSGATKGSRIDAAGNPIDVKYIQKALDKLKVAVGGDLYRWKMMVMAPETHASLIESRETDRRFQTVDDNKRGVKVFAYVHGNDTVETVSSEYVPFKRLYLLPEAKNGEKVIEYWGTDFQPVRGSKMEEWHLKSNGTDPGYSANMVSFMNAYCTLISRHPAAIGVVHNFTNS